MAKDDEDKDNDKQASAGKGKNEKISEIQDATVTET